MSGLELGLASSHFMFSKMCRLWGVYLAKDPVLRKPVMRRVVQSLPCRNTPSPGEAVTDTDDLQTAESLTVAECPGAGRGQRRRGS